MQSFVCIREYFKGTSCKRIKLGEQMEIRASCGDKPVIEMFGRDNVTARWYEAMIFKI